MKKKKTKQMLPRKFKEGQRVIEGSTGDTGIILGYDQYGEVAVQFDDFDRIFGPPMDTFNENELIDPTNMIKHNLGDGLIEIFDPISNVMYTYLKPKEYKKQIKRDIDLLNDEIIPTDEMFERSDEIYNATYQYILDLTEKSEDELPWNMEIIGHITDSVKEELWEKFKLKVRHPGIVTNEDGTQYYEEYDYEDDDKLTVEINLEEK